MWCAAAAIIAACPLPHHLDLARDAFRTREEVEACQELGIRMIDGLGIEMLLLQPFTQHYDWGKPKPSSVVAALGGGTAQLLRCIVSSS